MTHLKHYYDIKKFRYSRSNQTPHLKRTSFTITFSNDVKHFRQGFTIVELLIVVVVIAILAAITIVSYNGITDRAKNSAAASATEQATKKIMLYAISNADQYPTTLADAGVADGSTTYQYRVDNNTNPKSFCLTATTQSVSYYASSTTTTPTAGACAGHGVNGGVTITNLVRNPSSEITPLPLSNGGGATVTISSTVHRSGNSSTLLTKGSGFAFLNGAGGNSLGSGGETVTFSAWVRASVSNVGVVQRGNGVPYSYSARTVTPNTWTRISATTTIPTGATSFYFDVGWESSFAPSGATLYMDDVIATVGTELYQFADGSSPGWIWNGASNNSTSTGPPL